MQIIDPLCEFVKRVVGDFGANINIIVISAA